MDFLAAKDQFDGFRGRRGTWEEDEEARQLLKKRASELLLHLEKRRSLLGKKVSSLAYL